MWAVCYCIRLKTRHVQNPSIESAQSARYSQSSSHPEETCDERPFHLLVNCPVALASRFFARCVPPTWNRGRLHLPQGQPRPHPLSMPGWPPWFGLGTVRDSGTGVTWRKDSLGNVKGSDGTTYRQDRLGNVRASNGKSGLNVTWRKDSFGNLRASDGTLCRSDSLGMLRCDGGSTPSAVFKSE